MVDAQSEQVVPSDDRSRLGRALRQHRIHHALPLVDGIRATQRNRARETKFCARREEGCGSNAAGGEARWPLEVYEATVPKLGQVLDGSTDSLAVVPNDCGVWHAS
jgi:hypothetical protein